MSSDLVSIVVASDLHIPFHDRKALCLLRQFLEKEQPESFVLNGDIVDCYSLSRFDKDPKRTEGGIQKEFDTAISILKWIMDVIPNTKVFYIKGNHEDRFSRSVMSIPGLVSLRKLTFPDMIGLEDLGITYVNKHLKRYGVLFKHGELLGMYPAARELQKEACSGTSGHAHRCQVFFKTVRNGTITWMSTGHMSDIEQMDYIRYLADWQQGFGVIHINNASHTMMMTPLPILSGYRMIYNGSEMVVDKHTLAGSHKIF